MKGMMHDGADGVRTLAPQPQLPHTLHTPQTHWQAVVVIALSKLASSTHIPTHIPTPPLHPHRTHKRRNN